MAHQDHERRLRVRQIDPVQALELCGAQHPGYWQKVDDPGEEEHDRGIEGGHVSGSVVRVNARIAKTTPGRFLLGSCGVGRDRDVLMLQARDALMLWLCNMGGLVF